MLTMDPKYLVQELPSASLLEPHADTDVTIPGGAWLLEADFQRLGPDLDISHPDGQHVLMRGYFTAATPPDLLTENGARIAAHTVEVLAGPRVPILLAQAGAVAGAEPIGAFENIRGDVTVQHANGLREAVANGDPVYAEDVLITGSGSFVGVTFADDTVFSLGPNGRMVMDELVYDPSSTDPGSLQATVLQGAFSFISGHIAKAQDDAMQVTTPVATIGVRGTTAYGYAAQEGEESTFSLVPDPDGGIGEIVISTSVSSVSLSSAGATTSVFSATMAPPVPVNVPLPELQARFADALQGLPASPLYRDFQQQQQDGGDQQQDGGAEGDAAPAGEGDQEGDAGDDGEADQQQADGEGEADAGDEMTADMEAEIEADMEAMMAEGEEQLAEAVERGDISEEEAAAIQAQAEQMMEEGMQEFTALMEEGEFAEAFAPGAEGEGGDRHPPPMFADPLVAAGMYGAMGMGFVPPGQEGMMPGADPILGSTDLLGVVTNTVTNLMNLSLYVPPEVMTTFTPTTEWVENMMETVEDPRTLITENDLNLTDIGSYSPSGTGSIGVVDVAGNAIIGYKTVITFEANPPTESIDTIKSLSGAAVILGGGVIFSPLTDGIAANQTYTPMYYATHTGSFDEAYGFVLGPDNDIVADMSLGTNSVVLTTKTATVTGTVGTGDNDSLSATAGTGQDILVGTDDNETLTGDGGADILYGMGGNDFLVLSGDGLFARADGGGGSDTLEIGANLDLTQVDNWRINNIERICMTNDTANTLKLTYADIATMGPNDAQLKTNQTTNPLLADTAYSGTIGALLIDTDQGDTVTLSGGSWTKGAETTVNGVTYGVYSNSNNDDIGRYTATAFIDTDASVVDDNGDAIPTSGVA